MSTTVPADLPSAFVPQPKLAAVPAQPTAKTRETLAAQPPARGRSSTVAAATGTR